MDCFRQSPRNDGGKVLFTLCNDEGKSYNNEKPKCLLLCHCERSEAIHNFINP